MATATEFPYSTSKSGQAHGKLGGIVSAFIMLSKKEWKIERLDKAVVEQILAPLKRQWEVKSYSHVIQRLYYEWDWANKLLDGQVIPPETENNP